MREFYKEIDFKEEFSEHFKGFMLGDGYLSNRNKSKCSAQFCLSNVNPTYITTVSDMLTQQNIKNSVRLFSRKGGFKGSRYSSVVTTLFYKTFSELEEKWYRMRDDGTHYKKVPNDLKLTRTSLLHWYIGDGYLVHLRGDPVRVQFCTDRYTDDEIMFLRDCFERDIGLKIQIDWNRRRLRIPKRLLHDFFSVLPECPNEFIEELGYKWMKIS
ncbi:hypothetical protein [Mechercharimyces sp. CAU 1602]|uniref:hypothetical protein n=1 Tax=Mechercharimyces sp. CAU 1602 TaxID=2973933 RepID=UPI0021624764|nr:hypothetical protein [Mechercharimyces sp. CAU 1602]MCS1350364.1 hypothetical protein [Mechercharimyces sp. CAU 1602]